MVKMRHKTPLHHVALLAGGASAFPPLGLNSVFPEFTRLLPDGFAAGGYFFGPICFYHLDYAFRQDHVVE